MKHALLLSVSTIFLGLAVFSQPVHVKKGPGKRIDPSKVDTCHYIDPKTGIRCNKLIMKGAVYCFKHRPFS